MEGGIEGVEKGGKEGKGGKKVFFYTVSHLISLKNNTKNKQ